MRLIFTFFVFPFLLFGATATLDFDTAPGQGLDCGTQWQEEGLTLEVTPHTQGGACFLEVFGTVFMAPGQLTVYLDGLNVSSIEVDVIDYCGNGCTQAYLSKDGALVATNANQAVGDLETLVFDGPELAGADDVRIQSFEGELLEIRIIYEEAGDPIPQLDVVPDPSAPNDPEAYIVCWVDTEGSELQRSHDLATWTAVPTGEITLDGPKASHNTTTIGLDRCFYRLAVAVPLPQ